MTERTCVSCNKKREKSEMIRVSQAFEPDYLSVFSGRGFYVCPDTSCISKIATGRTSIRRSLRNGNIDKQKLIFLSNQLTINVQTEHRLDRVMNVQDKNQ